MVTGLIGGEKDRVRSGAVACGDSRPGHLLDRAPGSGAEASGGVGHAIVSAHGAVEIGERGEGLVGMEIEERVAEFDFQVEENRFDERDLIEPSGTEPGLFVGGAEAVRLPHAQLTEVLPVIRWRHIHRPPVEAEVGDPGLGP